MSENIKKIRLFLIGGIAVVVIYLIAIGLYVRISKDPIIFVASIVIVLFTSITICTIIKKWGGIR